MTAGKEHLPIKVVQANTAYDAIPSIVNAAREISKDYKVRVAVKAFRMRCGTWHYIAMPQPHQKLSSTTTVGRERR